MPDAAHAERLRLAALRAYEVLDSEPTPALEGLVALAAHVTGAGMAVVNLLDADRQWQAAAHGGARGQVPREDSMCRQVVEQRRPLHAADASTDPRWATSPFVDGRYGHVRMYASAPLIDADGHALGSLCVVDDTPRALSVEQLGALRLLADQVVALFESRQRALRLTAAVEELDRLAHLDGLTGLLNRSAAVRALDRICASGGWGLLFVDVDDFKAVNDDRGHHAGDLVLREVAARLREGLRPHDLLSRWAGDEFVALLADVTTTEQVQDVVGRLHDAVGRPYEVDGSPVELAVSVGGVVVAPGSLQVDVLRAADRAMYEAKHAKRAGAGTS